MRETRSPCTAPAARLTPAYFLRLVTNQTQETAWVPRKNKPQIASPFSVGCPTCHTIKFTVPKPKRDRLKGSVDWEFKTPPGTVSAGKSPDLTPTPGALRLVTSGQHYSGLMSSLLNFPVFSNFDHIKSEPAAQSGEIKPE